jgi:hypothetical protein
MTHTTPEVANRRVARYKARIEQIRRQARAAPTQEKRTALQKNAEMLEQLLKEAEQDSISMEI